MKIIVRSFETSFTFLYAILEVLILSHSELREGDTVLIRNCPPVSARKRFKLEKIIKSPETERDEMHARMAQMAQIGGGGPSRQSMDTQSTTAS